MTKTVITAVLTTACQATNRCRYLQKNIHIQYPSFHSQADSMYWMESEGKIRELVDMYPLTVDGLKHGIKKLMSDKK